MVEIRKPLPINWHLVWMGWENGKKIPLCPEGHKYYRCSGCPSDTTGGCVWGYMMSHTHDVN